MNKPEMDDLQQPLNRTGNVRSALMCRESKKADTLTAELKSAGFEVVSEPRATGGGYCESSIMVVEGKQIENTEGGREGAHENDIMLWRLKHIRL